MKTEITVQVFEDESKIKTKLVKNGFNLVKNFILDDFYYTKYTLSRAKKMAYKTLLKNSLLVRNVIKHDSTTQMICYKNKTIKNGEVVGEEKISSLVDDSSLVRKILESAGMNLWCELVTKSYIYSKGEMEFALQVIDGLGCFIELEEPKSFENMENSEKFERLKTMAKSLPLMLGSDFSCKKVFMKFKAEN